LSLTYVKIFAAVLVGLSEMLKAGTSLYFPTDPFPRRSDELQILHRRNPAWASIAKPA